MTLCSRNQVYHCSTEHEQPHANPSLTLCSRALQNLLQTCLKGLQLCRWPHICQITALRYTPAAKLNHFLHQRMKPQLHPDVLPCQNFPESFGSSPKDSRMKQWKWCKCPKGRQGGQGNREVSHQTEIGTRYPFGWWPEEAKSCCKTQTRDAQSVP